MSWSSVIGQTLNEQDFRFCALDCVTCGTLKAIKIHIRLDQLFNTVKSYYKYKFDCFK